MKVWRKRSHWGGSRAAVTTAALAGGAREQLLQEALKGLRQDTHAERIGVWLEPDASLLPAQRSPGALYGITWDHALEE